MNRWFLIAIIIIFALLSLLTLQSIAPQLAPRQFVFFFLGLTVFWLTARIPFNRLATLSIYGYIATCSLLIIAQLIAFQTRNTVSWIYIGDLFAIQPSQLAIPLVGLFVSYQAVQRNTARITQFIYLLIAIGIPSFLIIREPDLGTAVIYTVSLMSVLFFSKTKWHYWVGLAVLGIIGVMFAWTFVFKDYQKERVTSFGNTSDLQGANYNAQQSLIAVGSGQLTGRGLGQGVQSHLRFLPERQTDFIFASAAEEFGFIGSILILGLYTALIFYVLRTGLTTESTVGFLFCIMAATALLFQVGVNIGMNMGLMPITGITLPLISYGGSSLVSTCGLLGIIQSINNQQRSEANLHIH